MLPSHAYAQISTGVLALFEGKPLLNVKSMLELLIERLVQPFYGQLLPVIMIIGHVSVLFSKEVNRRHARR